MEIKNNVLTRTSNDLKLKINQFEDFNGIVAHNLRGPAGTIQYILNRMIEEESEEEKQGYMNMLVSTSKSLNETLDDLMNILEIKLNDQIHFDSCELKDITEKISQELTGEILKAKAVIKTNFRVATINFPKVYLESIFYNMISNSLKYRRKDIPAEINISSFSEAGKTSIVFEDNGLGIDLERYGNDIFKLNKIFHTGYDSKGVGLFITKNQIETHGGSIRVESAPNQGSKFTVCLN
jgi:signal transduction histidine kinase